MCQLGLPKFAVSADAILGTVVVGCEEKETIRREVLDEMPDVAFVADVDGRQTRITQRLHVAAGHSGQFVALFPQLLPEDAAVLTCRADDQNAHG